MNYTTIKYNVYYICSLINFSKCLFKDFKDFNKKYNLWMIQNKIKQNKKYFKILNKNKLNKYYNKKNNNVEQ